MKALTALVIAAGLVYPATAAAQAADPVDVAGLLFGEVCLPLVAEEGGATPERIAMYAGRAGMIQQGDRWLVKLGENSGLVLAWNRRADACVIHVAGMPEFSSAFKGLLTGNGFAIQQENEIAPDDSLNDLLCGQAIDGPLVCAYINRPVAGEGDDLTMTIMLMRAPGQ